jgi:tRNA threonylcarbamoyladenosine biosynthesis protein TsaB
MAKILAFDTHSDSCSVCLLNSELPSERHIVRSEPAARSHAQHILPMVDAVLSDARLTLHDLDGVAFGRGPGSFTGLRIAAGVAQGLAYGAELPVFPISNLQALAYSAFSTQPEHDYCLSLVDARMDEVYWAVFEKGLRTFDGALALVPLNVADEKVGAPESVKVEESQLLSCMALGSGVIYESRIQHFSDLRRLKDNEQTLDPAQAIAELALLDFLEARGVGAAEAAPVYIRDTVTWKKLPGR